MRITKYGHCCLVIEIDGVKILTDPGNHEFACMGGDPARLPTVDAIVITHEHPDHFHLPALKTILEHNVGIPVFATSAVRSWMSEIPPSPRLRRASSGQQSEVGVTARVLEDGVTFKVGNVAVTGIGQRHAEIYGDWNRGPNTGILVADRFFYPGDAFTMPNAPVEILALPIAGPWMKIKEAADYALALKPHHVFPVHDGMLKTAVPQHRLLEYVLPPAGIQFVAPGLGVPMEFHPHP